VEFAVQAILDGKLAAVPTQYSGRCELKVLGQGILTFILTLTLTWP
jgi:hypothetical protein